MNLSYAAIAGILISLPSCMLIGPDHSVPASEGADSYKDGPASFSSRMDTRWWKAFGDSQLNSLMSDLEKGNFDLRAAEARRNQAYASLGIDRSQLAPQVLSSAAASRNRVTESDRFNGGAGGNVTNYFNDYRLAISLGYELDLWGRVRRLIEAGSANAEAAEISVDQVKLSLQAQLSRSYFAMRFLDSEAEVLRRALDTREETLELSKNRFEGGKTSELDVARAEAELATTRAQLVALEAPRASLENAIALLAGKNPSNFSITPKSIESSPPSLSAGSPAQLLGRRPDVWVAERDLAASSARIGIAEAAFYPKISLIGTGGLSSIDASEFLQFSSGEFSVGPQVDLPLFQGLRRRADFELAKSRHQEALATYQQTVLTAFADVENALSARRAANKEISAQRDSVEASKKSFDLSNARYKEGISSSLEVVDAQRELLNAQRAEVQARGRAFEATVLLMQALGGGYSK